jgi:hypothetical protein
VIELIDPAGPRRQSSLRGRARVLRALAAVLLSAAGLVLVVGVVLVAAGGGVGVLVLLAGAACPALAALVAYAAARVAAREAAERLWLSGTTLVVADERGGRTDLDLSRLPVRLELRFLMSRTSPRPVWAFLRVAASVEPGGAATGGGFTVGGDRLVELCHPVTRALRPPAELEMLAEAVGSNPAATSQEAAGRLRTLAAWGSLDPLHGATVEGIPVTPPPLR